MNIKANDPTLKSWLAVDENSDFSIQNLPFGIIQIQDSSPRVASRIGNYAIDLLAMYELGLLDNLGFEKSDFDHKWLNKIIKKGKKKTRELRDRLSELLRTDNKEFQENKEIHNQIFLPISTVKNLLPVKIGDYTDFYSSIEHATNVGTLFRDPNNALLPNWKHIPVGYHGRASSIIVSGQDIYRPKGQQKPKNDEPPVFGASKRLDFELEVAFITYDGKPLGENITTAEADDYIFGMVL